MTSTKEAKEVILKRDGLGRVRTPPERRKGLLEEYDRSGLSGQKFAAWAGINYQTFATWLQKRRRKIQSPQAPTGWVEAVVKPAPEESGPLVVELGQGARLRIENKRQVNLAVELLREWSRGC